MKKNFFAKLGHFFLVSAVLFNGFGVGFVKAAPTPGPVETPSVWASSPADIVLESDGNISIINIYNATSTPIYIEFTLGGTATVSTDYSLQSIPPFNEANPGKIYVPASVDGTASSVGFPISIVDDTDIESLENIKVVFGNVFDMITGNQITDLVLGSVEVSIKDNDMPAPTFSTSTFSVTEGFYAGMGNNFTTLTNISTKDLTYTVDVSGSATLNTDYGFTIKNGPAFSDATLITSSPTTVTIPAGGNAEFYIATNNPLYNDGLYEIAEEAIFTVVNAIDSDTNTYTFAVNPVSTVTLEDNDSRIGFISNGLGLEIDEISTISNDVVTSSNLAKLSNNGDGDAMVVINFAGSTATPGTNFTFIETDPNYRILGETPLVIIPAGESIVVPLYIYNIDGGNKTVSMTIDKVIVGETEVPLTAVTGNKTHTFTIVDNGVPPENRAPIASTELITLDAIHVGNNSTPVSFPRTFSDPDLDVLTYSVVLSDSTIATYEIKTNGELVLTGTKAGTTTVRMIATDSDGLNASTTFSLTVTNNIPTVNEAIVTQRIDLHVSSTVIIDNETLQNLFSDLDTNDRVGISLTNNTDATVVTTTSDIEFSSLVLTGLKVGTSTIELTGNDQHGGIVTSTFDVVVTDSTPVEENTNPPTNNTSGGGGSVLLPNTAPQAVVTNGQEVTVEVNKEITFDASGSVDKEGNIRFYFWNFGDGSDEVYYTVPTVKYTYTKISNYTLNIKVKDAYGAESSAQVKVKVVAGKASTNTGTPDKTSNTKTETTTPTPTPTSTTYTATPAEETGSTGNTNNNTNNNTSANNTEEEATTTEEENTSTEEETTSENTEEEITEEVPAETTEELPTWIKIIFGSGALAAVAGAGLAINRVRKNV
ncbi:MAG: putative Ca2+-binding protein [uncultured bacterium]|nr:MAG: putative Ca2+-binding protein [uncultured bacterium]OGH84673.1 MAG: hypothetical protein A2488_00590 [Candidatus Magasanikbacteria bacterium RIFOXYC12_FULL_32_21b]OGH88377.1 MAG: hypothetical protein A2507_00995 [Candidatus Magasanikbacteria bacterium RIFOXYD12_FULL_33_17]